MNRKGFTLVELLGVIVVIALIMVIVMPFVDGYIEKTRKTSEKSFISNLSRQIDTYIDLYSSSMSFKNTGLKITKEDTITYNVQSSMVDYPLRKLIDEKIVPAPIVNPKNKKTCDLDQIKFRVYRDTEYVSCFKILKNGSDCFDLGASDYITNCPTFEGTE